MAPSASHCISFCSCPQIEKIMTLIGAGIDFSRDQQYATPGRVQSSLSFHALNEMLYRVQHLEIEFVFFKFKK